MKFFSLLLQCILVWVRSIAMSVSVCVVTYLKNDMSKVHKIFFTLPVAMAQSFLTTLQYIMYFQFCG